jgi:hypothetical protein
MVFDPDQHLFLMLDPDKNPCVLYLNINLIRILKQCPKIYIKNHKITIFLRFKCNIYTWIQFKMASLIQKNP